jgi:hypothetical protein
MADEKRIFDLDPVAPVDVLATQFVMVDDPTFTETQKATITGITFAENARAVAMENAIIAGIGLQSDGTYASDNTTNYIAPQDFVDAGLAENHSNALILLDSVLATVDDKTSCIMRTFTNAEILSLHTTPVTFVGAPGANHVYEPIHGYGVITFSSTAYAGGNDLKLRFIGGTDIIGQVDSVFIEASQTTFFKFTVNNDVELGLNAGIEAYSTGAFINGKSAITLVLCCQIADTTAGGVTPVLTTCCVDQFDGTFTNADLVGGWVEFNHALGTQHITVMIWDEKDKATSFDLYLGRQSTGFASKTTWLSLYCDVLPAGTFKIVIISKTS